MRKKERSELLEKVVKAIRKNHDDYLLTSLISFCPVEKLIEFIEMSTDNTGTDDVEGMINAPEH